MKGYFLMAVVILSAIFSPRFAGDTIASKERAMETEQASKTESMEEVWGIQIQGIRLTASGYMIDFRYLVVDSKKAERLFDRKIKPYLIHQKTKAKFMVPNPPKTGPLRNSNQPQQGRVYWMFFGNPGKYVKSGDKVTVIIGEFKAPGLVVE